MFALAVQAPGIALEIAAGGNDPMAGHDDGDGVGAVGRADRDGRASVTSSRPPRGDPMRLRKNGEEVVVMAHHSLR